MTLQTDERQLLNTLAELEASASVHSTELQKLDQDIFAVKLELEGVREEILDSYLDENLTPLLLTYVIKKEDGKTLIAVAPIAGGEVNFSKLQSSLKNIDMDNIPIF